MFGGRKAIDVIILMMVLIHVMQCYSKADPLPMPNGINFLGIGYNILSGNPEGGDLKNGGVDPGLLVSRKIFDLTFEDERLSSDQIYCIPDEVNFIPRQSAYTTTSRRTFYGTSSYASKLSAQVEATGSYSGLFAEVEFAASARYEKIAKQTSSQGSVFLATETISNLGNARYLLERAKTDQYGLDLGFVADVCRLPNEYDKTNYMTFIDNWGTHVVIEVNLGKKEGQNFVSDRSSFVDYASSNIGGSVSASGSYNGFGGSLSVNMDSFNSGMDSETRFGSTYSNYSVGNEALNEPISIKLLGIHEVFQDIFWSGLSEYIAEDRCIEEFDRVRIGLNLLDAMKGYAEYKRLEKSTDPVIKIPLTWPEGTYGLPKPTDGCPNNEFKWNEGFRYHDTEDSDSQNEWRDPLHLAGGWGVNNIRREFCMKTVATVEPTARWTWQPGSYCIYKYGDCPKDFESGWIYWDDEDSDNENLKGGTLPTGEYGRNTKIYYCCRNDGVPSRAIYLPIDNNFYLFPRFEHCQEVDGMMVTQEFFKWDTADGDDNEDSQSEIHPYYGKVTTGGTFMGIRFCYYQRT